jgi:CheY-like chemotaxis protein
MRGGAMHLNYSGEVETARESIKRGLGNITLTIDTLKEISGSDEVDLLFLQHDKKSFFDKAKGNIIPIEIVKGDEISMLAKAYRHATTYYCPHIQFDKHYNVSIDNPYNTRISSQIIMPLSIEDEIRGIIRFSKSKHLFETQILKKLLELEAIFTKIFHEETNRRVREFNGDFFSVSPEQAFNIIDKIKTKLKILSLYSRNPEINKLIEQANSSVESIFDYLNPYEYIEAIEKQSTIPAKEEDEKEKTYHILFADDVEMNLRILNAMIKNDTRYKVSFAHDGVEALNKIEKSIQEGEPIDILFLDHYMPGKLGLEVARAIRDLEKENLQHRTHIVSITNDPKAIEEHITLYDHQLAKPFAKVAIDETLEKIRKSRR